MYRLLTIFFILLTPALAYKSVTKTVTLNQMQYADKTFLEFKNIALEEVKKAAAKEIYGELLSSQTVMVDGKILNDVVHKQSGGIIRIKGEAKFKNGANFGDVEVTIEAYATKEDIENTALKQSIKKEQREKANAINSANEQIKKAKGGFYGLWSGFIMHTNGSSSDVSVKITSSGLATIAYNSLHCGGELIIQEKSNNIVVFVEKLSYGETICPNENIIKLKKISDTQLLLIQFNKNKQETAKGSLYTNE